jgi:hypothetical protein
LRVRALAFLFAPLSVALAIGQPTSILPETIVIPSGNLQLKGFLWKPNGPGPFPTVLFNHGSGGADADHTAGLPITEAAEKLAPVFLKHATHFCIYSAADKGFRETKGRSCKTSCGKKKPVGQTSDDGHNFLYIGIPQWEHDVFGFLDEHVMR